MKRLLFSIAFLGFVAVSMAAQDSENYLSSENPENGGLSDFLSQVIREQHAHARRRGWSLDEPRNAFGLKFGDCTAISFQRVLRNQNRLEFNVGRPILTQSEPLIGGNFNYGYLLFYASGLHQWAWSLDRVTPGLKWYLGVGLGAVFGNEWDSTSTWDGSIPPPPPGKENGITITYSQRIIFQPRVVGNIGIEYSFPNFPLQFALDYAPFVGIYRGEGFREDTRIFENIGLAIRWRF